MTSEWGTVMPQALVIREKIHNSPLRRCDMQKKIGMITLLWVIAVALLGLATSPIVAQESTPSSPEGTQEWLADPFPQGTNFWSTQNWLKGDLTSEGQPHLGLDLATSCGTNVLALADGTVMKMNRAAWDYDPNGWGNALWIDTGLSQGGVGYHYAHLQKILVQPGDRVQQGQVVATVGESGFSFGCHVHIGVFNTDPNEMHNWHQRGDTGPGGWVDPNQYLGTVVASEELEIPTNNPLARLRWDLIGIAVGVLTATLILLYLFGRLAIGGALVAAGLGLLWIGFQEPKLASQLVVLAIQWLGQGSEIDDHILQVAGFALAALGGLIVWGKIRLSLVALGIALLFVSNSLPTTTSWLDKPLNVQFGENTIVELDEVRHLHYPTLQGTPVIAPFAGCRVEPEQIAFVDSDSLWGMQLWLDHGQGLWSHYAYIETIKLEIGECASTGQTIANSGQNQAGQAELVFGLSSVHPNQLEHWYDLNRGWVLPTDYLGKEVLTGTRTEAYALRYAGFLVLLWGGLGPMVLSITRLVLVRRRWKDLPWPWQRKTAARMAWIMFICGSLWAIGWDADAPWIKSTFAPPTLLSLVFFVLYHLEGGYWNKKKKLLMGSWGQAGFTLIQAAVGLWVLMYISVFITSPEIATASRRPIRIPVPAIAQGIDPGSWNVRWPAKFLEFVQVQRAPGDTAVYSSVLPEFEVTYWNGAPVRFYAPKEVWDPLLEASQKFGCDPLLVLAVAHSESSTYNNTQPSPVGAEGVWQFMWETWVHVWAGTGELPNRRDIPKAAEAACRHIQNDLGFADKTDHDSFVAAFTGADGSWTWNQHEPQADYVWRLWQELQTQTDTVATSGVSSDMPKVAPVEVDFQALLKSLALERGEPIELPGATDEWIVPYVPGTFWVNGGVHADPWGGKAVDVAGGANTLIIAPITGVVTENTIDPNGSSVLFIESDEYKAVLLHGLWSVQVGDVVSIGDEIGTEGNLGYTFKMDGTKCGTGSDCGYHTHFNLVDKTTGESVDVMSTIIGE
jgi:murein DD-endopeptidase MepM/ murein hydrolase activator NlpD